MYSENLRNESVCAGLSNEYTHNETVCILGTRVRRFRNKKNFCFKAKRSETRSVSHAHVKKKNLFRFFSLHFASNFSLPTRGGQI